MRYLLTFTCYGSHLHGEERGSVDPKTNVPGTRLVGANERRVTSERERMDQEPYELDLGRRPVVLEAIRSGCRHRKWNLLAAHVRTNHVHLVVEADVRPEPIMNALKSYASRSLNEARFDHRDRKRWARHGSTRWLWKDEEVQNAIRYVVKDQGEPMAVFVAPDVECAP